MTLATGFAGTVYSGPLIVAALLSALVGVVGFLSPCVLPLVPGYLSYVAGLSGSSEVSGTSGTSGAGGGVAVATRPKTRRMLAGSALFVVGFTVVFVLEGALFGELGSAIRDHSAAIERVMGAVTIVLGLSFLGVFGRIGFFQREWRVHRLPRAGLLGAPLLGLTFGLAWTPCLTPTFTAVSSLAVSQSTAGRGAFLMTFYCLGLGIPFVLVAVGIGWVAGALSFVRRHQVWVSRFGGVLLVGIGVLLVTGLWTEWMAWLQGELGQSGLGAEL